MLTSLLTLLVAAGTFVRSDVISISLQKRSQYRSHEVLALLKRDTFNLSAQNIISAGGYYSDVEVGTPGQKLTLHLDTGSSDTWVNSVSSDVCDDTTLINCDRFFSPNDSSTYQLIDSGGLNITYLDTRNILGNIFNDTLRIAGVEIENQQIGLANNDAKNQGVMGLGPSTGSSSPEQYPTIVENMAARGHITRAAFSMYLNTLQASAGNVLFGGIDTMKYIGHLATLPIENIISPSSPIQTYVATISEISFNSSARDSILTPGNVTAIFDSGSTVTLLPSDMAKEIFAALPVSLVLEAAFINCGLSNDADFEFSLNFAFGNTTIKVPFKELILDNLGPYSDILATLDVPENSCLFGIQSSALVGLPSEPALALLGDTFLRSAYVVYDMPNLQLGIAQANPNATESNIVELEAGATDLPAIQGVEAKEEDPGESASVKIFPPVQVAILAVGSLQCAFLL